MYWFHVPGLSKWLCGSRCGKNGGEGVVFVQLKGHKYPTGLRTNRATGAGYWKVTGKDKEVYSASSGTLLGMKKTLVFYKGRTHRGEKTKWVMHEYRLDAHFSHTTNVLLAKEPKLIKTEDSNAMLYQHQSLDDPNNSLRWVIKLNQSQGQFLNPFPLEVDAGLMAFSEGSNPQVRDTSTSIVFDRVGLQQGYERKRVDKRMGEMIFEIGGQRGADHCDGDYDVRYPTDGDERLEVEVVAADGEHQLRVLQYPLRPHWRPCELDEEYITEVRLKPITSEVEFDLSVYVDSPNIDKEVAEKYNYTKQAGSLISYYVN
ncbi:hypothetical protein Fmac_025356 [Flemingia macrophylla]|uniref:NAC domain-containing protein n=1 Tax=Flemingia macrophylla TaxID=520843 RepID=A0ABD1LSK4_9FABA